MAQRQKPRRNFGKYVKSLFKRKKRKPPPSPPNPLDNLKEGSPEYEKAILSDEYEAFLDWEAAKVGITFDPIPEPPSIVPGSKEEAELEAELERLMHGEDEPELSLEELEEIAEHELEDAPPAKSVKDMLIQAEECGIHFSDEAIASMKDAERFVEKTERQLDLATDEMHKQMEIHDAISQSLGGTSMTWTPEDDKAIEDELEALSLEAPEEKQVSIKEDSRTTASVATGTNPEKIASGDLLPEGTITFSEQEVSKIDDLEKRISDLSSINYERLSSIELDKMLKELDKHISDLKAIATEHSIAFDDKEITPDAAEKDVRGTDELIRKTEKEASRDTEDDHLGSILEDDSITDEEIEAAIEEATGKKPAKDTKEALSSAQQDEYNKIMGEALSEFEARQIKTDSPQKETKPLSITKKVQKHAKRLIKNLFTKTSFRESSGPSTSVVTPATSRSQSSGKGKKGGPKL